MADGGGQKSVFEGGDLADPAGVATAVERGGEEQRDDLVGETDADHPAADRQDVGVVVGTGEAGGVEIVAQRGAHAADLVGRELLALAAAADDDADLGLAVAHRPPDGRADRRVVDRHGGVGAEVDDVVALLRRAARRRALELEPGVVGRRWRCASSVREPTVHPLPPRIGTSRIPSRPHPTAPPIVGAVAVDPRTPVIVGRRPVPLAGAGPRRRAGAGRADGAGRAQRRRRRRSSPRCPPAVDSIRVVRLAVVALRRPGVRCSPSASAPRPASTPSRRSGGNMPQALVNRTALDIAAGRLDIAVLVGGEAWRTRIRARAGGGDACDWDTSGP